MKDNELDAAVDAYCRARLAYDDRAAHLKAHPYSETAQARCDQARRTLALADDALIAAWLAAQTDPIPALLARLEAVASTGVTAQQAIEALTGVAARGEALEEQIVGAEVQP